MAQSKARGNDPVSLIYDQFNGGIGSSIKGGGSFAFNRGLNVHEDKSYFKALPRTVKDSGSIVTGKVIDAVRVKNGDTYFLDQDGKIYKRTAAGTWSFIQYCYMMQHSALKGHWLFDQSVAGSNVSDDSGNGNTLTNYNTTAFDTSSKHEGLASGYFIPANSNYFKASDSASLDIQNVICISLWIAPVASAGEQVILQKGAVGNLSYSIELDADKLLIFRVSQDGTNWKTITSDDGIPTDGTFTHILCQASLLVPRGMSMYFNGELQATTTASMPTQLKSGSGELFIGCNYDLSKFYSGRVDSIILWQTLLTAEQIYLMYKAQSLTIRGMGLYYWESTDYLYIAMANSIAVYGPITGTPYVDGQKYGFVVDQLSSGTGQTYTLGTTIQETAAHKWPFVPTLDYYFGFRINFSSFTAFDWPYIVIHDDSNNVVATADYTNAPQMGYDTSGSLNFYFTTPWRPIIGASYHMHIYGPIGGTKIVCGTLNSLVNASGLAEASISMLAHRLIAPKSGVHPFTETGTALLIANEKYVVAFDGTLDANQASDGKATSAWKLTKLTFPAGYEAICFSKFNEYTAIGCEYRGTNTNDFSDGYIFFWDGVSSTFNFYIRVEEGGVQAMLNVKNRLYFIAGLRGEWFVTDGTTYDKVLRLPKTADNKYSRAHYASVTNYQGMPCLAASFETDNANFEHQVYTWGSNNKIYADVLNGAWPISTGTYTGITVAIGMIKAFGTDLFIAWKDGTTYGVDLVSPDNSPFASAVAEFPAYDHRIPWHKKFAKIIRVDHQPIPTGGSVQIGRKVDQETSFTYDTANSTVGSTETRYIVNAEFKDIQVAVKIVATTVSVQVNDVVVDMEGRANSELI